MDQWHDTHEEPAFERPEPALRRGHARRGYAGPAWVLIALAVAFKIALPLLLEPEATEVGPDPVGEMLIGIQGRYLMGAAAVTPQTGALYQQVKALDVGSLGQRLRVVVLAAEFGGRADVARHLEGVRRDIETQTEAGRLEPSEEDLEVLRLLEALYPAPPDAAEDEAGDPGAPLGADALDADERAFLVDRLGWFGRLALSPGDEAMRAEVLARARKTFWTVIGAVGAGVLAGAAGFVGLLVLVIFAFMGRLRGGLAPGASPHWIYAETFAIWLAVFLLLQIAAGLLAAFAPEAHLVIVLGSFFVSLLVLAWPCLRGIPWRQVRGDIGWTAGRGPVVEPIVGLAGYAMALPILAGGVMLTFLLLLLDGLLAGAPEKFASASGPAHPIVAELGSGNWWVLVQILLLGSVAAPIIEETMFRGVLYRHLRDATRGRGPLLSIVAASLINAFVFAVIHPQGWVAVPALMSLAIAFSLAREWRGTVIPAMVIHGVSNGLVLGLITMLAAT